MRRSLPLMMVLAVLVMTTGCKNKPPVTPAAPTGPATVRVNDTADYTATTTDPNKDKILYIFDWDDTKFDTTALFPSGDAAAASHTWSELGYYAVRVKAKDEKGNYSPDWSDSLLVHVVSETSSTNTPPNPPAKPTVTGARWIDSIVYAATSATDPDGDSVRIKFYWSDGQVTGPSALVPSGTTVTNQMTYTTRGSKFIRAVAIDAHGDSSDWSPAESIYIDAVNTAPNAPTFVRNANPRRGIADGPTYRFYAQATDPQGDSVRYVFYWPTGDSFVSQLVPSGNYGMGTFRPTGDTATYIMRVRVFDQFGVANATLGVDTFSTVGEGSIIWARDDDFVGSPALGKVTFQGQEYPGIVVGSTEGWMYFIDAYQSSICNQRGIGDQDPFNSSPAVAASGRFYVGCDDGGLYAYDIIGDTAWRFPAVPTGNEVSTTPLVDGNAVYFGGEDWRLHKLVDNGTSYTEEWSMPLHNELIASPAMDQTGNIVAADDSGYVTSFSASGSPNWTVNTHDSVGISSSPAIASDGTIYIGTEAGRLHAIKDGQLLWSYEIPYVPPAPRTAISSSPIIGLEGHIYFTADDGKLYRIDPTTHLPYPEWPKVVSTTPISSTPALAADGVFYTIDDDEKLWAYNGDGSFRWAIDLIVPPAKRGGGTPRRFGFDAQPSAMIDQYGIIYITSMTGVFAVAGRVNTGTLASTPWPMFHHDPQHTGKATSRR